MQKDVGNDMDAAQQNPGGVMIKVFAYSLTITQDSAQRSPGYVYYDLWLMKKTKTGVLRSWSICFLGLPS